MSNPASSTYETDSDYYVEEEEGLGEEEEEEEEIFYNSDDFISTHFFSENGTLPGNIFEFDHSYGYDCRRYYNLTVADEETVIFASGNFIHVFNTTTKKITFRRSAFGGGIGFITKNPHFPHIAVAENTTNPPIIIYHWPTLEIVCLLKGGATKRFRNLNYNPDGLLLVSQAGAPDYLITIWNWTKKRIVLRTKAHVQDVFCSMFSPFLPGQLASCGASHIKFWKMATTFTGLKLQGELGRFGKTEFTDIIGILPLEDEKVVSGCFWGNILLWEGGLIKIEVMRRQRKRCHDAPVVQFFFQDGEICSISMDGHVKSWYYPQIDQADPPDNDRVVEMEPSYDVHVPNLMYMYIEKMKKDPENFLYYAQDGNGGIWRVDLDFDNPSDRLSPEKLYFTHGGPVMDLAPCPWGPYFVTLGLDGKLHLYDYISKQLIFSHQFPAKGNKILWLPTYVEPSGEEMILAFDDGCLRVVILKISENKTDSELQLIQITKPHISTITQLVMSKEGKNIITGGEDKTIFIYKLFTVKSNYATLVPIGYIQTPDSVTYITWHRDEEFTLIVGCLHGQIMQVAYPSEPQSYTTITYILDAEPKYQRFTTYKAQIRRDIKIAEIEAKKAKKLEKKMEELEKIRKDNPGLEIEEDVFLADSSTEEELEPLHIPEVPNRIIWIQHTADESLWLSMGGYDAGYIYEYHIDQKEQIPSRFQMVHDGDDIEIEQFIYNSTNDYLIFAMEDGSIRVNRVNPEDWRDLSDYWQLSMHDNFNGKITRLAFSFDEKYFFSCGYDGNIFSYKFFPEDDRYLSEIPRKAFLSKIVTYKIDDGIHYDTLTLEQAIVKKEQDRINAVANERKRILIERLKQLKLQFYDLMERNKKLLPSQIIPSKDLEISPKITNEIEKGFQARVDLVKRKLAFRVQKSKLQMEKLLFYFIEPLDFHPITVTAINSNKSVKILRQRKLSKGHEDLHKITDEKILEEDLKARPVERPVVLAQKREPTRGDKEKMLEYFLVGLSPSTIRFKLGAKLTRLLEKYRARKAKWEKRSVEWDFFNFKKPNPDKNPEEDEKAIENALLTIGDVKLKTSGKYRLEREKQPTTLKKFKEMLNMRDRIDQRTRSQYRIRYDFNKKVYELRDKKVSVRDQIDELHTQLQQLNREVPKIERRQGIPIPRITDEDFPERNLEVRILKPKATPRRMRDWEIMEEKLHLPLWDLMEKEALPSMETEPDDVTPRNTEAKRQPEFFEEFFAQIPLKKIKEVSSLDYQTLLKYSSETEESPWEKEMKYFRLIRKLFNQEQILHKMRSLVEDFDADLEDLTTERLHVVYDAGLIDIHLLTLYQELIILKNSEDREHELMDKANEKINAFFDTRDSIIRINNRLGNHKAEVTQLEIIQRDLTNEFYSNVTPENKFYSFLRRIFKKKYKPPKIKDPDESSSSSSSSESSESEEDEAASVDSKDFGIIRLDENVCPKGCDKALYDLTFTLRNKRWDVEQKIMAENEAITVTNKELDNANKDLKVTQTKMNQATTELEIFQREKQGKLNDVISVAILKFHQLQHITRDNPKIKISDTTLFDKSIVSKLYKRIGQLHQETLQQQAKRKVNIKHLTRMKTDCRHMEEEIKKLQKEIGDLMKKKFGKEVNINELEEAMLRKMILELRMSRSDVRSIYEHELKLWRDKLAKKQEQLVETIKSNSARLELLAALNRENTELTKFLSSQPRRQANLESFANIAENYKEDLNKLNQIVKGQRKYLLELEQEIRRLKTKGLEALPEKSKKWIEEICVKIEEKEESLVDFETFLKRKKEFELYHSEEREILEDKELVVEDKYTYDEREDEFEYDMEEYEEEKVTQESISDKSGSQFEEAKRIVTEMLEKVDLSLDLVGIIDEIWIKAMGRTSVAEIVDDIINILPLQISDENLAVVETAAEQLYALQEPEVSEGDIFVCARETILEVIEEVVMLGGEPHQILAEIITELVIEVPVSYLRRPENLALIKDKITGCVPLDEVDLDKLRAELTKPPACNVLKEEIKQVLEDILENVFGTGIDLIYVIKDPKKEK